MICSKCGREYNCPSAISRVDNKTEICPVCGVAEAAVVLPEEEQKQIIADAEKAEINNGRVKPLLKPLSEPSDTMLNTPLNTLSESSNTPAS